MNPGGRSGNALFFISLRCIGLICDLAATLSLMLFPSSVLRHHVERIMARRVFSIAAFFLFFKSGRSAMRALFERISEFGGSREILIPDYICNVVHKALKASGLKYRTYKTDPKFRVDFDDLLMKMKNDGCDAVLLASIFGTLNTTRKHIERIREVAPRVIIVLDECQSLVTHGPTFLDDRCVGIFSFNNKNIRGVMGGGLFAKKDFLEIRESVASPIEKLIQEGILIGVFIRQVINRTIWISKIANGSRNNLFDPPRVEYSYCDRTLPYWADAAPISKISLVRALLDLIQIDRIEKNRSELAAFYARLIQEFSYGRMIATKLNEKSPYIPFDTGKNDATVSGKLPVKGPYAMEEDPDRSLRNNMYSVLNDGRRLTRYEKQQIIRANRI